MFGVLVHGKSPLPITCYVADVPFEETVKEVKLFFLEYSDLLNFSKHTPDVVTAIK